MAKEMEEQNIGEEEQEQEAPKKTGKWLKIGVPVILVQIIAAYFLASYLIIPMFFDQANASTDDKGKVEEQVEEDGDEADTNESNEFGFIFKVEDVIVNPAESRGSQFVLVNIAFEVEEEDDIAELERREPQIRDILIRIISSKTIDQLDGPEDKEMLREEIIGPVGALIKKEHLKNVYFVNYIIQ